MQRVVAVGRFLSSLLGRAGPGPSQPAGEPPLQTIDLAAINFSMSTISDDLAPLEPVEGEIAPSEFVVHEDEWRQIEFFAPARLGEIQAMLKELARFEAASRNGAFFRHIYLRKLPPGAVLAGNGALGILAGQLGVGAGPGPILFHTSDAVSGRVENGFSLQCGGNVQLYGHMSEAGIMVLGANVGAGGDDSVLIDAFVQLNRSHSLIAVDWRQHILVTGMAPDGSIALWRPD